MSGMILTQANCTFVCPLLAGTIQIIETQVTDFNGGSQALTKNTKLIHTGSCAALNGAPCPNPLNLLPWELGSFQCNIRINGVPVLNEHAAKVCRIGQVRVGCIVSPWAVNASILTPLMDMELPVSAASANVTDCSKSALKPSTVTENSETNYSTEKTPEQMNSKKEFEQEGEKDSYFSKELDRCDSAKCPKRAECEYLKASSTLSDRESKQPSKDLRDNAKAEDKAYEEWQNSLMESERMKWGNEAHHLISIFAAFNQYPHLVKLAHFYGYEINCKENCIFLPSISRKESNKLPDQYGKQDQLYKESHAYDIMGITKQQWHVSQHQYDINHDVLQMVPEEYRAKLKCYNMKVNEDVKEIYEAFIDYLGGKGNITCYYDSRETMIRTERASQFKSFMNSLSDRIRGYLDAFIQPKKSYPYFISEMALNYAYRLPHTGKIVCAVYHGQEGRKEWKLELYQYTRYNKNNNQVELKLKDSYIADYYFRENTEQLVTFFSNARHFSVFDKYNRVSLPFNSECTTYYIHCDDFEYSIYTEHDVLLRRLPSDTKLKSRVVINEMSSVFGAVLQQDANEHYISPATMINKRRRECGLL